MLKDFKQFIAKGNVLDLAVGVVLGLAFGKIITSFVNDILMTPIGLLLGKVDFSNLFINLSGRSFDSLASAKAAGAATINYGVFLNTILDFLIVAFAIFMLIRIVRGAPKDADVRKCPFCTSVIADEAIRCPHCTSDLVTEKA